MNSLNLDIIATKTAIDFCSFVIADPSTPPPQIIEFTNYLAILIRQQKQNTRTMIANVTA